jgi:hypothetical protein
VASFFKRYPLATVIGYATTALALLVGLQAAGILTGQAADWANTAAAVIQVVLTVYAKAQVTPVVNPRDNQGRRLAPVQRGGTMTGGFQ